MLTQLRQALVALLVFTAIIGIAYPLAVTGIAQLVFPNQANGSLLPGGRGSSLIGQSFDDPKYFWTRLSGCAYNAAASSGTNYAMTNPALIDAAKARINALRAADPGNISAIPVDLVTASGSGLDPHISLSAARYQTARVARARGVAISDVERIVAQHAEQPLLGFLGEPRVNVVLLNHSLDLR